MNHNPSASDGQADITSLLPHHLEQLTHGSGIALEVIRARGYRSIVPPDGGAELSALGFSRSQAQRVPGLLMPILGRDGQPVLYQLRPDTPRIDGRGKKAKVVKYETPTGASMHLDFATGQRELMADPKIPLWITEGIKKVDALRSHGFHTIGLLGVNNWRGRNDLGGLTALAEWETIALNAHRPIFIVFDSDVSTKAPVNKALRRFSAFLEGRGAQIVVVYLPADGAEKVGVDDYLLTHSGNELQDLADSHASEKRAVDEALDGDVLAPYLLRGDGLYLLKGEDGRQLLCNFMAWITEERTEDDGIEAPRMVMMNACLASGKRFGGIPMPIADFYSLAGLQKALGTEAVISPGVMVKDRIRHAFQLYSHRRGYPQRQVYTHLGWRQVGETWHYLAAEGSWPKGIEVNVQKSLSRYRLSEVFSPKEALAASVRLLDVAPMRLMVPLLAMSYLAPLSHWLEPDFLVWLEGETGAKKSTLAALCMCHFGAFTRVHPPENWESTANTLERVAFLSKDTVLWIDDYAPQATTREAQEQQHKAQRMIRDAGNLSGRGRMRADTSLRPAYYPRGVILSTGELHPTGKSTFGRMLQLEVGKDDVNLPALSASQQEASRLNEAMTAYIQWLHPQIETRMPSLKERWETLRDTALPHLTGHPRHPEVYAHLATAWALFLEYACRYGVLTEDEHQKQWQGGCEILMVAINRQQQDSEAEDPVRRFLAQLQEAFAQRRAYLQGADHDETPEMPGQWGWTYQHYRGVDEIETGQWRTVGGATMVGWVDDDWVYLIPDASYRYAAEALRQMNILLLPQQALWKLMVQRGMVQRGRGHLTQMKKIRGASYRVLFVRRSAVEVNEL